MEVKLAALWTSLMFLYIYVDYFHLYMPHAFKEILSGRVYIFDISSGFLMATMVLMSIPSLMIFLSVALKPALNRVVNIVAALLYIPCTIFNLGGEVWIHMVLGVVLETGLLCFILYYAWKWPRQESSDLEP